MTSEQNASAEVPAAKSVETGIKEQFPDARFDREWRAIESWDAWYERWKCVKTFREAVGLLHCLPFHEVKCVRFLIELLTWHLTVHQRGSAHRCLKLEKRDGSVMCPQGLVGIAALRKLFFDFLKEEARGWNESCSGVFGNWPQYEEDPHLLPETLRLLRRLYDDGAKSDDTNAIVRKFLYAWLSSDGTAEVEPTVHAYRALIYEVLIIYGGRPPYPKHRAKEHLETLHAIALAPPFSFAQPSENLDAVIHAGWPVRSRAAEMYLIDSAKSRVDEQQTAAERKKWALDRARRGLKEIEGELASLEGAEDQRAELLDRKALVEAFLREHAPPESG